MLNSRNYVVLVFVAACIFLNVFAFVLYSKNQQINESSEWVKHTYEVIAETHNVFSLLSDMVTGQRGFLLTGNESFTQTYERANERLDQQIVKLQDEVRDNPPQAKRVEMLTAMIADQRSLLRQQIEKQATLKTQPVPYADDLFASKRIMDQIRKENAEILEEEHQLLETRTEDEARRKKNYTMTILFSSAFSIVGMLAISFAIIRINAKRREVEENLASSDERFALAIAGMQDGVFDYSVKEGTIYFSPRLKEMLGYSDKEFANTLGDFNARMHPEDREKSKEVSRKYFSREIPAYHNVFRMLHKNGTYRWIMSRGAGVWDRDGNITRLVGAHTDITEQREYEENLKRMNNELETFTYIASHDLRSPLVNLKGFAGEMRLGLDELSSVMDEIEPTLNPEQRTLFHRVLREDIPDALGFIHSSVVKMDRLTNGILELSRIGRRQLKREVIDMSELARHAIGALSHQIHEKNIEVTIGELPSLTSDPLSVEQVVGNVLDNAIKYLDPSRPGKIFISGEPMGELNLYRIQDNGRGISQVDMQKIFEIFRRAGNNDGIAGEGMGMAYVKATLRRLGGTIWAESKEGEGTTFFFTVANIMQENLRSAA